MTAVPLAQRARIGVAVPHRSPDPVPTASLRRVAARAEVLGFAGVWVTENTLDRSHCLDPLATLSYVAGLTERVQLGTAVLVLPTHHPVHVAQQWASLQELSGGRAVVGVGLGSYRHLSAFGIDSHRRVARFLEQVQVIRRLWRGEPVTFDGELVSVDDATIGTKLGGSPPPLWFGGMHPAALRRAARYADGWVASGHSGHRAFGETATLLRRELEKAGREPASFPVAKRIFVAVDDRAGVARDQLRSWLGQVYGDAGLAEKSGLAGTAAHVAGGLEELVEAGATDLVVSPVVDHEVHVDAIADLVGMPGRG